MRESISVCAVGILAAAVGFSHAGLVGHWKLDETATPSGNTIALDSSGNALDGIYQPRGGPGPVLGGDGARMFTGSSATFTGSADEVFLAHPELLNNLTSNLTVMAWIRPNGLTGVQRVFARHGGEGWGFGRVGNKIRFTTWTFKDFDSPGVLANGKWQHIAVTFNENSTNSYTATFYLNAIRVGSASHTQPASTGTTRNWFIGSHGAGERFKGSIDDVRVYDHVMTATEISDVVFNGPPFALRDASAPVFIYRFPASFDGTTTSITDRGNGLNHGAMDNAGGYYAGVAPPGMPGGSISGNGGAHGRTDAIDLLNTIDVETHGGFKYETWFNWPGAQTILLKMLDYAGTDYLYTQAGNIRFRLSDTTVLTHPIASNTWHQLSVFFDTDGNTKEEDTQYGGFMIKGHLYMYVDGALTDGAANVYKTGYGESLGRSIGINRHPTSGREIFTGFLYDPAIYLGAGIYKPAGTVFVVR